MNIDISVYRQRIGSFSFSYCSKKPRNMLICSFGIFCYHVFTSLCLLLYLAMFSYFVQSSSNTLGFSNSMAVGFSNLGYWVDVNFLARYKFGNKSKGGLKIMHWNAGGGFLKNKINEIEIVTENYKPHVLGISESCFMKEHDLTDIEIANYDVFLASTLENPDLNSSRIAVYVHKDVSKKKLRPDLMDQQFSSIWLEIGLERQKSILLGNIYREWQYLNQNDKISLTVNAQLERFETFIDKWARAIRTSSECHVLGDMNLNFLEYNKPNIPHNSQSYKLRSLINLLIERILPLGAVQCVTGPTRFYPGCEESGLDHYYTTDPQKLSNIQTITNGASDHKMILGIRSSARTARHDRIIKKRSYKNFNNALFVEAVRNISWWEVYCCDKVEDAIELLTSKISKILDEMAPVKVIQNRKYYAPWLSVYTKELMKVRDVAFEKFHTSQLDEDWHQYKIVRNKVANRLKYEKVKWQESKLMDASVNSSKSWSFAKTLLGWSSGGPPNKLIINNAMITKPYEIAQSMNNYFVSKVQNIVANLPVSNRDPLELPRMLMKNKQCSFDLKAVHPDDIEKIIANLKPSKSCGLDNIDAYVSQRLLSLNPTTVMIVLLLGLWLLLGWGHFRLFGPYRLFWGEG